MIKAPEYDIDFYSDAAILDPWTHYARMRSLGPVIYLPRNGNFALTRHAEVSAALRDNARFVSGLGVAGDSFGCAHLRGNTVASDPPRHDRLRKAMAPPLFPGALAAIRPKIDATAVALIESLTAKDGFDTPRDLSRHLPLAIVRDMVGFPDHGQERMLKWAAAAFDVLGRQNRRGRDGVAVIGEMRAFIGDEINPDTVRPGSWTARILGLVSDGVLDPELAPYAIRDYTNPSLDTTISATSHLVWQLSRNPRVWETLRSDPSLCRNAANEAVRLGSPVRSFTRTTAVDVEIAGVAIPAGRRVMMLYGAANRDGSVFPDPDRFDLSRPANLHLGFGSGIHMCVGMHLAQLEMVALLEAMIPRVERIRCDPPRMVLNNTISAIAEMATRFEPARTRRPTRRPTHRPTRRPMARAVAAADDTPLELRVTDRFAAAEDIICLDLAGHALPPAEPGSHVDLFLREGLVRQYSLTGDLGRPGYRIAVQIERDGRGGSRSVSDLAWPGASLRVGRPRNGFPLRPDSRRAVLFSGGIGLTPILAMAYELARRKRDFHWHLSARSLARVAFLGEILSSPFADRVTIYRDDDPGPGTIADAFAEIDGADRIYLCGPEGYMDLVTGQARAAGVPHDHIHLERFGAEIDPTGSAFEVVARKSGKTLAVDPKSTILHALRSVGIPVPNACRNGVCGSCLTPILEGRADHRDLVLTDAEKAANTRIAVCCSRALSRRLVLDV